MFGFISKKKLIKEVLDIALSNDTENAAGEKDFYFRSGVHNGLSILCFRLGINLTEYIGTAKAAAWKED